MTITRIVAYMKTKQGADNLREGGWQVKADNPLAVVWELGSGEFQRLDGIDLDYVSITTYERED